MLCIRNFGHYLPLPDAQGILCDVHVNGMLQPEIAQVTNPGVSAWMPCAQHDCADSYA